MKNTFTLSLLLLLVLFAAFCSCSEDKAKQACQKYLEKIVECSELTADEEEQYWNDNISTCDTAKEDYYMVEKIFPCADIEDCFEFFSCMNGVAELDGDSDESLDTYIPQPDNTYY